MFKLFDFLDWKIPLKTSLMIEKKYCSEHEEIFSYFGFFGKYISGPEAFVIIKKSIIIQAFLNKKQIEEETELYSETELENEDRLKIIHDRLPYFTYNGVNIYVPFFTPAFNKRYDTLVNSLTKYPFILLKKNFEEEIVDPFETYCDDLFNSPFCRLIYICGDNTCSAYYHAELKTIFVINKQGTLDHYIPLFDEYIKYPNYDNIFSRLKNLLSFYFSYDKHGFINALYENEFISYYLFNEINSRISKTNIKKIRKIYAANDEQ